MSLSPEVRALLERRIEAMRGAREGLDKLTDAAIEDHSLRTRLAAVMGEKWVSILVRASGAAADEALSIEFELQHPPGACVPKGAAS